MLTVAASRSAADGRAPRPLPLTGILAWKRIQSPSISNNGQWFAYRRAPAEGNAEVVLRNVKSGQEPRFPVGDPAAAAPGGAAAPPPVPAMAAAGAASDPAISADSRWAAFHSWPTTEQTKRLKKDHKPIQTKVVLVELATGKKTEEEKARRFAFSGERATHIALLRYGAADGPPGAATSAAGAPGSGAADRPSGADLLLHELATGAELNIGNAGDFAFDEKGEWFAYTIDAPDKAGNGIELRNMISGATQPLDNAAAGTGASPGLRNPTDSPRSAARTTKTSRISYIR